MTRLTPYQHRYRLEVESKGRSGYYVSDSLFFLAFMVIRGRATSFFENLNGKDE